MIALLKPTSRLQFTAHFFRAYEFLAMLAFSFLRLDTQNLFQRKIRA